MNIIQKPIAFKYSERKGFSPQLVVIHISEGSAQSVYDEFNGTQKSSHYLVLKNCDIWQFEDESKASWAQGLVVNPKSQIVKDFLKSHPSENINEICFGIEHEAKGEDLNPQQYQASAELVKDICQRWNISVDREHIIGHNEIRVDKLCPKPIQVDLIINLVKELVEKERQKAIAPKDIEVLEEAKRSLLMQLLALLKEYYNLLLEKIKK